MSVQAGFDGYYRSEDWAPVTVHVANEGGDIEGLLRVAVTVSGPNEEVVYSQPISLPNRSDKRTTLFVHLPGFVSRLTVELLDSQGRLVREVQSDALDLLGETEVLYGVVSSEPGVWTFLEQAGGAVGAGSGHAGAALLDLQDLPQVGVAWEALDVLILNNVDSARLTGQQQEALRGWLGLGGRLVVTGGPGWQQTAAGVQELLPVTVEGSTSVPDLPALAQRVGVPFRDPGPYLVAQSALRSGAIILGEGDLPLLARREIGRGAVYFLALDPTLAPLLDWRGSEPLWAEIAGVTVPEPIWAHGPQNPYMATEALSSLPALALPSVLGLLFFLGLYVVIVGPANYYVVRRLGRRELAWVTIPALILIFSALAYVAGFQLRGNDVILNQISVAYGAIDGSQAHTTTLLGIYSPRRAVYDVQLPADSLVRPFSRNFGEISGSGSEEAISQGANVTLQDVRVDVSGIETYVANSYEPLPPFDGLARLSLDGSDARIEIDVQNNSDFALEKAGILVGGSFISLGDLQPGARATQSQALLGSTSSAISGPGSSFSSGQTLSAHYEMLLGTSDFYSDEQVQARFQLLESLQYYSGAPQPVHNDAQQRVTLVGWSRQPQLAISMPDLPGEAVQQQATTLYFLELPIENVVASGQGVRVPPALFDWIVDSDSSAYTTTITDFYLPLGRIDLTFTPWPAFQNMDVTEFQVSLTSPDSSSPAPELHLWNWPQEAWIQVPNVVWGNIGIADFEPFIGEQNTVRMRLENSSSSQGLTIERIYPVITGDLE